MKVYGLKKTTSQGINFNRQLFLLKIIFLTNGYNRVFLFLFVCLFVCFAFFNKGKNIYGQKSPKTIFTKATIFQGWHHP